MKSNHQRTFADAQIPELILNRSSRKKVASGLVKLLFLSLAIAGISPVVLSTPAQAVGSWSALTSQPTANANWTSIATSKTGTVILAAETSSVTSTTGYLWLSTDSGATWSSKATAGRWNSVSMNDTGTVMMATQANGLIYKSTDSGATWTNPTYLCTSSTQTFTCTGSSNVATTNETLTSISLSSAGNKAVVTIATSGIRNFYYTSNSGTSWGYAGRSGSSSYVPAFAEISGDGLLAYLAFSNSTNRIYYGSASASNWSSNYGSGEPSQIWSRVSTNQNGSRVVAAGSLGTTGVIVYSSNSGVNWSTATSGLPASAKWSSVSLSRNSGYAIAVAYGGYIYSSADYGATWAAETASNQNWISSAISADGTRQYAVVKGGSIYSRSTTAQVPTISTQPTNQSKTAGQGDTLTVVAPSPDSAAGGSLSYQWYKSGSGAVSGAVAANFVFNPVSTSDTGTYYVVVKNTLGGTYNYDTSTSVTLSVAPALTTTGSLTASAVESATAKVAYSLDLSTYKTGGKSAYTYSIVSGTLESNLSLNTSTGVISGTPLASETDTMVIRVTDANLATLDLNFSIKIKAGTGTPLATPTGLTVVRGSETATITWTAVTNATSYNYVLYKGPNALGASQSSGSVIAPTVTKAFTGLSPGETYTITIEAVSTNASYTPSLKGSVTTTLLTKALATPTFTIDTTTVYSQISLNYTADINAVSYTLKIYDSATALLRTVENYTSGTTVNSGSAFTPGTQYKVSLTAVGDGAHYTSTSSANTSFTTTKKILTAPTLTARAESATAISVTFDTETGASYTLKVWDSTGASLILTKTTYVSGSVISSASLPALTEFLVTVQAVTTDSTKYTSSATSSVGTDTNSASITTLATLPVMVSAAMTSGAHKSITVHWNAVSGSSTYSITGYTVTIYSNAGGLALASYDVGAVTWETITASTFSSIAEGTTYRITVTALSDGPDSLESGYLSASTMAATGAPTITVQPAATKTNTFGSADTLTVTATTSDGGTLSYQWRKNGSNISGATSNNLVFSSLVLSDAATYSVVVTNTLAGTAETSTSTSSVLTVNPRPITVTPSASTKIYGSANPTLSGFTISGGLIGGDTITAVTETTTSVTLSDVGSYTIYASAAVGTGEPANYALTYATGSLSVTQKALSTTTPTIAFRVYNATKTGGVVTLGTITGYVGSDTASVTITPTAGDYETSTVGSRTSTVSYVLGGAKGGNYSLASSTGVSGSITKATPVFSGSWAPTGIRSSTVLSTTELSPVAANWNVPGSVAFTPALGTTAGVSLGAGSMRPLIAVFTPSDRTNYNIETETASIDVSAAIKPGSPIAPVLTSVSGTPGALLFVWSPPTDNGDSAILRYEYRVARADLLSWPSSWSTTASTETTTTITGLTNGKSYLAQVRAINAVGESAFTQTVASAIPSGEAPQVQSAPTLSSATPDTVLGGKVTLVFTAPSVSGNATINAFLNYQYTTDGGSTWRSTADTATTIVVTGLTNGTVYTFKVRVVNAAGAGTASSSLTATPRKKPELITGLTLTAGASRVVVTFTPPTDNGGSALTYTYKIRRSTGSYSGDWKSISSLTDSGSSKTFTITKEDEDTNISTGLTYYVKIKSTNTWFSSDESGEVSVNSTVAQTPVIDTITADSGFTSGRSFTLGVGAHKVGTDDLLSYRWYKSSDTATTLSTASTYTVSSATTADSGDYYVIVTATLAANGTTAQATNRDPVTITINGPPTISNKSSIPGATQGVAYSFTLAAAGTGPITWPSISSSLLPTGLSFTSSGANAGKISGTVDAAATTKTISMTLTDGMGVTNLETFTITVSSPLTITTKTIGSATKGVYYYSALVATGGAAPYTWSITGDNGLPAGLNLYNDTRTATSYISDTATAGATSKTFTLKVRDANGVEKSQSFTLSIAVQVPGTPILTSVDSTTVGTLIVNWQRPTSNYSFITGYTINFAASSDSKDSNDDKGSKTYTLPADDANTSFSYTLTSLSKGRTYAITVSAYSAAASGTASNSKSQKVGTKPNAPKSPTITQTKTGMQVRWNKSEDDGGDDSGLNYEAECWDTLNLVAFAITFSSREHGDSEHGDSNQERGEASGFAIGHSYKCHIRGKNSYGTSDWSADSAEAKYTSVPSKPTIDTATATGIATGKLNISWRALPTESNGGEVITSYTVSGKKKSDDNEDNKKGCTVTATSALDTSGYTCQLTGLPSKGQMTVYLYASNKNGLSDPDSMTVYITGKTQHLTVNSISTKSVNDADFPVIASIDSGQKISMLIGSGSSSNVCEKSSKGQIHLKRAGTCIVVVSQNGKASSGDENKNDKEDNGKGDHNNNCSDSGRDSDHPTCDDGQNHGDDTEWEAVTPVTLTFLVTDIAPLAPISVSPTAGNGQLTIKWTPASGNSGKPDSYTVEVRTYSGTPADTWAATGNAPRTVSETNTVVTGLTNGTAYQVRVRSINSGGNSPWTIAAGSYTPMTVPDAPTINSVDGFDETSTAVVKWTKGSTGGSAITGFRVTGTSTGISGTWTCNTGADPAVSNYQCSISGLSNKYTYSFVAIATNANGNSINSNAVTVTLNGINQSISISDTPTATGWYVGAADPIINARASSGLTVLYASTTTGVCTVSNTAPSVGAVHFIGSGDCRITMDQSGAGSKYNAATTRNYTMTVDQSTPASPTLSSVTNVPTGLSVVWILPEVTGGGTLVESVTATNGGNTFNCTPASGAHTCILTGLTYGLSYTVYVKLSNAAGTSPASNTMTGIWAAAPSAPQSVAATTDATDGRAIKLSWNKSATNNGSAILRYEATATSAGLPEKLCSVARTDALDTATAYTCTITGARAGATYSVTIVAVNAVGKSTGVTVSSGQLGLVQTITVQPIGSMRIGDADTQTVASITSAQPLTYTATSSPSSACSVDATTGAVKILLVGSCTITVSQPGATDANESQYKSAPPQSVTFTIDPAKPGEASIKSISANATTATVNWRDTSFDGGASTNVAVEAKEAGSAAGSCSSTAAVLGGDRTCTISGLTLGHEYTVIVTETNIAGSTPSRAVSVKTYSPNPTAPEPISAAPGASSGTVNWSNPSYIPESATITSFEIQYRVKATSSWSTVSCSDCFSKLIEGLTTDTEYEYQVHAISTTTDETHTVTTGDWSGSAFAKTFNVPSAPLNLSGIRGYSTTAKVSLSWSVPTSNGGSSITSYLVKTSGGTTIVCADATATSCEISSLSAGTSYTFLVHAVNAVGDGPDASITLTTINKPQSAPSIVATVVKDDVADTAIVSWVGIATNDNGGSAVLSYKVITFRADDSTETGDICIVKALDIDSATAYSCTFTGVKYKTNLKYKVLATNIAGNGTASDPTTPIQLVLAQTITFPTILTQSFSAASVALGASASSGATVRYTVVSSSVCSVSSDTSTVATFLTSGICEIRADQDGEGTNYSAASPVTDSFTVSAVAPAPITLNQLTPGAGQIRATWSPRTQLGGSATAQYLLSWSRTNDFTTEDTMLFGTETSTTITSLVAKTLYYLRVKVVTPTWETGSAWSNVLSATTFDVPAAPVISSATQNAPGSVVIVWTDVPEASTGGSPITGYTVEAFNASTGTTVSKTCSAASTTCTIAGLSGGIYHRFKATAFNAVGSATSAPYPSSGDGVRPGATQTITASDYTVLHTSATFALDASSSSGLALTFTKYGTDVKYDSITAGFGTGRTVCTVNAITGVVTVDLAGTCQIAIDQDGSIDSVTASSYFPASRKIITVTVQPTAPSAPTRVSINPDDSKLYPTWSAPDDDGGVGITRYDLYYWVASADPSTRLHNSDISTGLSRTISTLVNGTKYAITIYATNIAGLQGTGS